MGTKNTMVKQSKKGKNQPHKRNYLKPLLLGAFCLCILCFQLFLAAGLCHLAVQSTEYTMYYPDAEDQIPSYDYLLIPGAGIVFDQPNLYLQERLETAIMLYEAGISDYLIISGGRSSKEFLSETQVMQNYLLQRGIPDTAIFIDEEGTSTYHTIQNTKALVKDASVLICTQELYAPRTMYYADYFGVNSAIASSDIQIYTEHQLRAHIREYFSCVKSVLATGRLSFDHFHIPAPSYTLFSDLTYENTRHTDGTYDREAAVAYSYEYVQNRNTDFASFDSNCTNYISQILIAGGKKMDDAIAPSKEKRITYHDIHNSWFSTYTNMETGRPKSYSVSTSFCQTNAFLDYWTNTREMELRIYPNSLDGMIALYEQAQIGDIIVVYDTNNHPFHLCVISYCQDNIIKLNANTTDYKDRNILELASSNYPNIGLLKIE